MKKVAIYHFSDMRDERQNAKREIEAEKKNRGSVKKRPIVNEKQMAILNEFANQYGTVKKVYLDKSLLKCEQKERDQMILDITKKQYDILVTKDFYHISKNTGACIGLLQQFLESGCEIHSIEDGCFVFTEPPFDKQLKVAIYHSKYKEDTDRTLETQRAIFNYFVESKTNWKIIEYYIDEANSQSDSQQTEIFNLIKNKQEYDIILCKSLNSIHWRTAKLCARRKQMELPIYSLKEGFLDYRRENLLW